MEIEPKPEPGYAERVAKDYAAFRKSIQKELDKKITDNWSNLSAYQATREEMRSKHEST